MKVAICRKYMANAMGASPASVSMTWKYLFRASAVDRRCASSATLDSCSTSWPFGYRTSVVTSVDLSKIAEVREVG